MITETKYLLRVLLLFLIPPLFALSDNQDPYPKIKTEPLSGLGCVLEVKKTEFTLGEKTVLKVGVRSERLKQLYLYFTPPDKPDSISMSGFPKYRRLEFTSKKEMWFSIVFTPQAQGKYTFCAQISSASPTASVVPFRAFSEQVTITVIEAP